jgi:hypothetical protein
MSLTIRTSARRPATLANVVDALETSERSLGVHLAALSGESRRQIKLNGTWYSLDKQSARVSLRLQFERNGFRPVSNRMLSDALAVAVLPQKGDQ